MSDNARNSGNFDLQLQAQYRLALAHVSPQTRLRLHPRQVNATSTHWAARRLSFAALAIVAVAVGLLFRAQMPFNASNNTAATEIAASNVPLSLAVWEEDPAFLAWLGDSENDWIASQ